jgi:hypothetical protein
MTPPNIAADFQSALDAAAPDPRNVAIAFPLDSDGEPTAEALRQFAAIVNAADQAEKGRTP